jgi:cardiolipin synthase
MAEEDGGEGWRDDMVQIEGPAVHRMRRIFLETWHALEGDGPTAPVEEGAPGASDVRVLANHYFGERRAIRRAYLTMIRKARERIYITNSYFVPDRIIRGALTGAVRRGVEVRVLLPGEGDVPAVFYAGRKLYDLLLRRGIHIHEYQGNVLHAKTAVVDGSWCTVGTYNLDYRSWRFNLEVTALIHDALVAGAMERRFREDIVQAKELTLADWRYRSIGERLAENFFYLFRKLL